MARPLGPPPTNPFKDNALLASAFDNTVRAYLERASNLFTADGQQLRTTDAGAAFWKGFDGAPPGGQCPENSIAFACYRAGRAMAERGRGRNKHPPARKLPPRY